MTISLLCANSKSVLYALDGNGSSLATPFLLSCPGQNVVVQRICKPNQTLILILFLMTFVVYFVFVYMILCWKITEIMHCYIFLQKSNDDDITTNVYEIPCENQEHLKVNVSYDFKFLFMILLLILIGYIAYISVDMRYMNPRRSQGLIYLIFTEV